MKDVIKVNTIKEFSKYFGNYSENYINSLYTKIVKDIENSSLYPIFTRVEKTKKGP